MYFFFGGLSFQILKETSFYTLLINKILYCQLIKIIVDITFKI